MGRISVTNQNKDPRTSVLETSVSLLMEFVVKITQNLLWNNFQENEFPSHFLTSLICFQNVSFGWTQAGFFSWGGVGVESVVPSLMVRVEG